VREFVAWMLEQAQEEARAGAQPVRGAARRRNGAALASAAPRSLAGKRAKAQARRFERARPR
jgi:hypothetical protein